MRAGRAMREDTHRVLGGAHDGLVTGAVRHADNSSASSSNVLASRAVSTISTRTAGESRSWSASNASVHCARTRG
jgi:hypothetical protein